MLNPRSLTRVRGDGPRAVSLPCGPALQWLEPERTPIFIPGRLCRMCPGGHWAMRLPRGTLHFRWSQAQDHDRNGRVGLCSSALTGDSGSSRGARRRTVQFSGAHQMPSSGSVTYEACWVAMQWGLGPSHQRVESEDTVVASPGLRP